MKKSIEIPAQFVGYASKVDRSMSLRFNTSQEMADEDLIVFKNYFQLEGYLLFSPNRFNESDIPQCDTPESGLKTPSERLRAVLYKLHIKRGGESEDFTAFYRDKMGTIISHFKKQLDEVNDN